MAPDTSAASTSMQFASVSMSHIPASALSEVLNLPCRDRRVASTSVTPSTERISCRNSSFSGLPAAIISSSGCSEDRYIFISPSGKNSLAACSGERVRTMEDTTRRRIPPRLRDTAMLTDFLRPRPKFANPMDMGLNFRCFFLLCTFS